MHLGHHSHHHILIYPFLIIAHLRNIAATKHRQPNLTLNSCLNQLEIHNFDFCHLDL